MSNEIELKLRIAAADIPRLRRHSAVKACLTGKPLTRRLVSIYYDTPDLQLLDAGISLRVRRMSGGWFQAVKGAGQSIGGLHQRLEWEDIIARGEPDCSKITEPALAAIFADPHLRGALAPVFTTDVKRTEWQLEYADGSAVEMALDIGALQVGKAPANDHSEPILELELELKCGDACHLFALALALQQDIALQIENVSKAQRGYAYYRAPAPALPKARPIALRKKTSVEQAFQAAIGACVRNLQENHALALADESSMEGVHQMRIAVRRLKAASKLFRARDAGLRQELRWLSGLLGAVRDWDVLRQETLADLSAADMPDGESLDLAFLSTLQQRTLTARKRAYAKLRQALAGQRYQRLVLRLGAWMHSAHTADQKNAVKYIARRLQKSYKALGKYGRSLAGLQSEQLHRLRLKIKYLRYAAGFFTAPKSRAEKMIGKSALLSRLTHLQQQLGKANDRAVAETLLMKLAHGSSDRDAERALTLLKNHHAKISHLARKQTDKHWRALLATKTGGN